MRRVESLLVAMAAILATPLNLPLLAAEESRPNATSPVFELRHGERYLRIDGTPAFVLGRNPVGVTPGAFAKHFQNAAVAGERFVRIHFTYSPPGEKAGEVHRDMLKSWDAVLDAAETNHLAVLPVLGIWSDWNDGSHGETWHHWGKSDIECDPRRTGEAARRAVGRHALPQALAPAAREIRETLRTPPLHRRLGDVLGGGIDYRRDGATGG